MYDYGFYILGALCILAVFMQLMRNWNAVKDYVLDFFPSDDDDEHDDEHDDESDYKKGPLDAA